MGESYFYVTYSMALPSGNDLVRNTLMTADSKADVYSRAHDYDWSILYLDELSHVEYQTILEIRSLQNEGNRT